MNQNKLLAVFMVVSIVMGQHRFSGFVNFSSANRLNDASLIRLPYRIAGTTWDFAADDYSIYGDLAMEYYLRNDLDFMNDRNTQEFLLDMRELFFQFYWANTEFRIGKQIHSWGMVDENSPLDVVSAYDYYYLFNSGAERKLGSWSLSTETYLSDVVIKTVFSPFHQTNRLPFIDGAPDPEFGFNMSVSPQVNQFIAIDNPMEYGLSVRKKFSNIELNIIFFSGHDRLFNLSGVNAYGMGPDISFPKIDIVYGYRRTNLAGFGMTSFIHDFTIRSDFGFFRTEDLNTDIRKEKTFVNNAYDSLHFSYPLKEQSDFFEYTIQIEYDFPSDINFVLQYFKYDTLNYSSGKLPIDDEVDIPNLEIDPSELTPSKLFIPGIGAPIAALSNNGIMLNLEKSFLDNRLSVRTGGLLDIDSESGIFGTMIAVGIDYEIEENLELIVGLTRINGDKDHPDGEHYRFNEMEDFSNFRMQLEFRF